MMKIKCRNFSFNGVDKNNNPINEEKVIDIPNDKYDFNELIIAINRLLEKDKNSFKASLEGDKVIIDITKSTYRVSQREWWISFTKFSIYGPFFIAILDSLCS